MLIILRNIKSNIESDFVILTTTKNNNQSLIQLINIQYTFHKELGLNSNT